MSTRAYLLEQVDDAAVVQVYADGFAALPLREKILIWHLYRAAIAGRDIFYDQRYAHNLVMREVLEPMLTHADGLEDATLAELRRYTKLFWIREEYGSKSISLSKINEAYEKAMPEGFRAEFSWTEEELARAKRWGTMASELTTDMHEVIGHGSGRMDPDLSLPPQLLLKEHYSALEESRADLVALYFIADPKVVELGLVSAENHAEIVRAEYESYARNALVQLRRVREGTQLEEDHMRNRQMIVLLAAGEHAGHRRAPPQRQNLLRRRRPRRVQGRRRHAAGRGSAHQATGDYDAAKALFERHGIHFDPALRDEVVSRVSALNLPSYTGFVMPRLEAKHATDGSIADVEISYPQDLTAQMLEYARMGHEEHKDDQPRRTRRSRRVNHEEGHEEHEEN